MGEYCQRDVRLTRKLLKHLAKQDPPDKAVQLELAYDAFLRRHVEPNGFCFDVEGAQRLRDKLRRRIDRVQSLLDRAFPPKEVPGTRPSYYTLKINTPVSTGDVPKFSTIKDLEAWRKAHGIRPKQCERIDGPPETKIKHFNANSSQQVRAALEQRGFSTDRETASGEMSTTSSVLWHSGLPEARLIVAYRDYAKIHSFTTQWLGHLYDGRIYPKFVGLRAATGRSAGKSPNVQQIPSTKDRKQGIRAMSWYGSKCRALFRPSDGYVLIGADLAGIEIRLLGHRLARYDGGDFGKTVVSGTDIHQRNADKIGISRSEAKTVLYGSLYGEGIASLSAKLEITKDEAKQIKGAFTTGISGFEDMLSELHRELRRSDRIILIDGRRIEVTSEHKALNYAIQGEAAILFKHWALESHTRLADTSLHILAVVHDEIQAECLPEDVNSVKATLESMATDVGRDLGFKVPIAAEAKHGASWRETH